VTGVIAARLLGTKPNIDLDAALGELAVTRAGNFRIGILQRRHHARHAGFDDGIGARRRFALVRTWLERHVESGALRRFLGAAQRLDLGMRAATFLRPAATENDAVLHDHRADGRIGPGVA